jgi:hypothetical protein
VFGVKVFTMVSSARADIVDWNYTFETVGPEGGADLHHRRRVDESWGVYRHDWDGYPLIRLQLVRQAPGKLWLPFRFDLPNQSEIVLAKPRPPPLQIY